MSHPTTRRFFLGAATAAAATRVWGANEKINVGIVGLGGRGSNHLNVYSRLPDSRVAVICDIDQAAREKANATLTRNGAKTAQPAAPQAAKAAPAAQSKEGAGR